MTNYLNIVQFVGLVTFIPSQQRFLLPKTDDHTAFLAFPDGDADASQWGTIADLNFQPYKYILLNGDTITFPNATGGIDLHSPGFLPHLRQCCVGIGDLKFDAAIAAIVSLPRGDFGWTGDGTYACSTVVDVETEGYMVVVSGGKKITFNKPARLVIGNSPSIPLVAPDEQARRASAAPMEHWEHYYEMFEQTEGCHSIPPHNLCVFAKRNPKPKNPLIEEKHFGAEIDCSNSQYP